MGEKLVIGPINRGLRTDREPFVIDNDSFPVLKNAYQWRGRILRKRGTTLLGRLQRQIGSTNGSGNATITINPVPITSGIVSFQIGSSYFVDPGGASPVTLLTNDSNQAGPYTLNRSTGVITITGSSQINTPIIFFPSLPVMGLEDYTVSNSQFPGTIGFDTDYAYNIGTTSGFPITDITFYKNPISNTYTNYTAKGTPTPFWWNGANYQQFWSTNYEDAFWATNGITLPIFTPSKVGMQFKPITGISITTAGNGTTIPAVAILTISSPGLIEGDFLFINQVQGITGINFQTGYVTAVSGNNVTVTFQNAILGNSYTSGGIAQYLTNSSDSTKDCMRWYDGTGWVNFCPPLSQDAYIISDENPQQYYLVTARMVLPFKDRILFFGPVIQSSSSAPIWLQDTVIYSENGTPYYTASWSGDIFKPDNGFIPILVPDDQSAEPKSFWEDQTGFGGFIQAAVQQPISTVSSNEDALIIGFANSLQTRFVYTGNDIIPFQFYIINAELGSASTFSAINKDEGVITRSSRGFIQTSQTACQRIDLDILPNAFRISNSNNGSERFTAARDFINEWIYFTYCPDTANTSLYTFPTQTLQYNYRDNSWAIFDESYTTYGSFRQSSGFTWLTTGYKSWREWSDPWISGNDTLLQPWVIAGNQQGFIVFRGKGTNEATSLTIQNISMNAISCPNHCLSPGEWIMISEVLGSISPSPNGQVFQVATVTNANTFTVGESFTGNYQGGGLITKMYVPFIQSKQFPVSWNMARKTRLGPQQYLLSKTDDAQVTLYIYLSQDAGNPYNAGPIVPAENSLNDALIYSTVLYTCPESTNLGLTPANVNLQTPTASTQNQIWHRINTSLLGDTVQFAITLSDEQMETLDDNGNPISQFAEIEFHGAILDINPSQLLV